VPAKAPDQESPKNIRDQYCDVYRFLSLLYQVTSLLQLPIYSHCCRTREWTTPSIFRRVLVVRAASAVIARLESDVSGRQRRVLFCAPLPTIECGRGSHCSFASACLLLLHSPRPPDHTPVRLLAAIRSLSSCGTALVCTAPTEIPWLRGATASPYKPRDVPMLMP
jgi:hypothetical protein